MMIRSLRALHLLSPLVFVACASSADSKTAKPADSEDLSSLIDEKAEREDKAIIERHQCLGDNDKPRQCESDEDCCEGFYCGRDPQVSDVIKICMSTTP